MRVKMNIKKQNNKIVILDWGGVIESHRDGEYNIYVALSNIVKQFNSSMEEKELLNRYLYCNNELNIGVCNKTEDIEKWFYRLKNELDLNCNFQEFCKIYKRETSKVEYYQDVVLLAHNLKKYCNIGILSNLIFLDKTRLNEQVNLEKFDYVWLSFEIESRKPNEKIYKFVEQDCKILPNNILFIDDKKENCVAAKQRGWQVCQASGYEFDKIKDSIFKFIGN